MNKKGLFFLAIAVAAATSGAQAAPRCTVEPPKYPKVAKDDWAAGIAVVDITIAADGRVERTTISQSSGNKQLDEVALESAASARCHGGSAATLPQKYEFEMISSKQYWEDRARERAR